LPLLEAIAAESLNKISAFTPQMIANTAWSFAKLSIRHQPLLSALSSAAISKISEYQPQDLSNSAWAFASLAEQD